MIFGGIDPGRRSGVALVRGGRILFAVTVDGDALTAEIEALRAVPGLRRVGVELARAYPVRSGRPAPRAQDIVRLAGRARDLARALGPIARLVEPRGWKGTMRADRFWTSVRNRLHPGDIPTWDRVSEHAKDAIALARWTEANHDS